MKHERFFNEFMENEVNLNKDRLNTLEEKTDSVVAFLKKKIKGYKSFEKQGSYATKTIIKPPKDKDFDADIMIYIEENETFKAKDYIDDIYDILKDNGNYTNIVERRSRCVTLDYKGDFHLDIVPCIETNNEKYICNRNTNKFEITDGTAYQEWLNEKNENSGSYLKKVTKLSKYMRDIKTNFSCKSILLTTLLGNEINNSETFLDLPTALKEIFNKLNSYLQNNQSMPTIRNPVLDDEDFNRHWNEDKYKNFRDKISLYTGKINEAFEAITHNESVNLWREVFGDQFGELQDNTSNTNRITGANKPYCDRY